MSASGLVISQVFLGVKAPFLVGSHSHLRIVLISYLILFGISFYHHPNSSKISLLAIFLGGCPPVSSDIDFEIHGVSSIEGGLPRWRGRPGLDGKH